MVVESISEIYTRRLAHRKREVSRDGSLVASTSSATFASSIADGPEGIKTRRNLRSEFNSVIRLSGNEHIPH